MKQVLIFAGTTEGRQITEELTGAGISCKVCVATEYGKAMLKEQKGLVILEGRLGQEEMEKLMSGQEFLAVIDATHPFATEVSMNIRAGAEKNNLPYLRLKRRTDEEGETGPDQITCFPDSAACAKALADTEGAVFLTTGSKELAVFCKDEEVKKRLVVRVLPGVESIEKCREAGMEPRQILALQGPFSEEMNRAFIREYGIKHLVTKETGKTGGYPEKVQAALKEGIRLYVIGNPEKEAGLNLNEVCREVEKLTGKKIFTEQKMSISLIGTGMGNRKTMTCQGLEALKEADCLFGAERLLSFAGKDQKTYPFYLSKDILPVLDEMIKEQNQGKEIKAAVLFSGDSGFYSGCEKMYGQLMEWKEKQEGQISVAIYPGISSLSYFAAKIGISWQDASVLSLHGRNQDKKWYSEVLESIKTNRKTFLLLSGLKDIKAVGALLEKRGLSRCRMFTGYQLSYEEESIQVLLPKDCEKLEKEGLYVCLIENQEPEPVFLTHGRKDGDFIREKVPMTKEEVRQAAICKLKLTKDALVYDVGSGTGSIAVEMAERSGTIKVYAVEQKPEAVALIARNCEKFQLENVEVVEGKAPESLENLPAPTHAFIGGSSGNLESVLNCIYKKNPKARIVITAISLETVSEITRVLEKFPTEEEEIVQMQVSRSKKAGSYHLMQAENPVYICSFCFR